MKRLTLAQQHEQWRGDVREQMQALLTVLGKLRAPGEDTETVVSVLRQLNELFLLVVVGEFNSGKSAAINALLGRAVLEEGVVPTTTRIQVLKYGDEGDSTVLDAATLLIQAPIPLLQDISIVDTPGTNAIEGRHEAITTNFIPRADLVVFVTSADRPFSESERAFLSRIRDWGKKIVIVINKIDILQTSGNLDRVEAYVEENARQLLGISPEVFSVSSRIAFRAKTDGDASLLRESYFEALEDYMVRKLDQRERVRLKLLNPLGVG